MAIESVPRRVTDLEERESILYGFMDDLRTYMKKMDARLDQHEEDLRKADERIAQNEEGLRVERERIDQNERMIVSLSVKQDDLAQSLKSQAEMLGMVLRVLDRIDKKLDDRDQPGKNGSV